jgi:CelD/BcsL family acetyltransferase involved in cellulose biosynthesis
VRLLSEGRRESRAPHEATAADLGAATVASDEGGVEVIDRVAEEWRRLCEDGPNDEPFYRPEWIRAYVRAFEPAKRLVLITARVEGRLAAVLPLIKERRLLSGFPVTMLRSPVNAHSVRFDAVRGAGPEGDAAVAAMWQFLTDRSRWDVLQLSAVPRSGALEGLCQLAGRDGFLTGSGEFMRTPYIPLADLPRDQEPWRSNGSANFRSTMSRGTRKANARGPMRLQRVEAADPGFLQRFYDLERAGWKGTMGSAIACRRDTRQFYDEVAQNAAGLQYLSLYFLELDGQTVAAHFGLTHRERYFMLKVAMDETHKDCAPGHLMINAVVADCVRRGLDEFDFTGPWAEYKGKWTTHVRPYLQFWVFRRTAYGRLLHAVNVRLRGQVRFRARLRGLLGRIDHSARRGGQPA